MAILKIKLTRNLRRSILRGHPWVYKESIAEPKSIERACLSQILDAKGELAWAIYDPHGPLSLRILSLERAPPSNSFLESKFKQAYELRSQVFSAQTNSYRLFNGEGDQLPGLVCDIYDKTAVLQFDGKGPGEFWNRSLISDWLLTNRIAERILEKKRRGTDKTEDTAIENLAGAPGEMTITTKENGALFKVNLERGQKTGFFLDQRDNRLYLKSICRSKKLLNLFSYTGGFSISAGLGGAHRVSSVDISQGAIELAEQNWQLNGLDPSLHKAICEDVFKFLSVANETWDVIVVDPPSMSHSENQKVAAKQKYIETFTAAAKRVSVGGHLLVSSCSSHISFEDFFEIINETLSNCRRRGRVLRVSGQGPDHPFPHACHELRYLKFVHIAMD